MQHSLEASTRRPTCQRHHHQLLEIQWCVYWYLPINTSSCKCHPPNPLKMLNARIQIRIQIPRHPTYSTKTDVQLCNKHMDTLLSMSCYNKQCTAICIPSLLTSTLTPRNNSKTLVDLFLDSKEASGPLFRHHLIRRYCCGLRCSFDLDLASPGLPHGYHPVDK